MYKFLVLIIIILISHTTCAIEIVTSTTPLASLIKMLTKENIQVSSIVVQDTCPHHYQVKFSDIDKIKKADLIIYIDDEFDGFINKLNKTNNNVVMLSKIIKPYLLTQNNNVNWHFWLDLKMVHDIVLPKLAEVIISNYLNLETEIKVNLKLAQEKINQLSTTKTKLITNDSKIALATDSLVYFFRGLSPDITELYKYKQTGLQYVDALKKISKQKKVNCILTSEEQDIKIYQNFNLPYVQIASENWSEDNNLSELYYKKYLAIINTIYEKCYFRGSHQ